MMLALKQKDTSFKQWLGETIGNDTPPPNVETVWSDQDLAKYGLYKVSFDPVPSDKIATAWTLTNKSGLPVMVPTLQDKPAPVPTFEERLVAVEKKLGL